MYWWLTVRENVISKFNTKRTSIWLEQFCWPVSFQGMESVSVNQKHTINNNHSTWTSPATCTFQRTIHDAGVTEITLRLKDDTSVHVPVNEPAWRNFFPLNVLSPTDGRDQNQNFTVITCKHVGANEHRCGGDVLCHFKKKVFAFLQ